MTIRSWRVEVIERILLGREFNYQAQPKLTFAVRADVPSAAKKAAKDHFRTVYGALGSLITVTVSEKNKIRIIFEAHRQQTVPIGGKIQQRPGPKTIQR